MKTFLLTVALCAAISYAAAQNKREVSHLVRTQDVNNKYLAAQPNNQYLGPAVKSTQEVKQNYKLPATNYGVPVQATPDPAPAPTSRSSAQVAAPGLVTSYGTPVVNDAVVVHSTHIQPAPQVYQAPIAVSHQAYSAPLVHTSSVHQAPLAHQATTVVHQVPESIFSPEVKIHTEDKYYIIQRSAPVVYTPPVFHQEIQHVAPIIDSAPESIFSPTSQVEHGWNAEGNFDFQAPLQFVDGFVNYDEQRIPSAPIATAPVPVENVQDDAVVVDSVARSSNVGAQFNQAQIQSGAGYVY